MASSSWQVPDLAGPGADADASPVHPAEAVQRVLDRPQLLRLVAQPIVSLQDAAVAGWELLSRVPAGWQVSPDSLFAAARTAGRSANLTYHVLRKTLTLMGALPTDSFLTVNIDPVDLTDSGVVDILSSVPSLAPLVLEITEHGQADDDESLAVLERFRARGALIATDDIGIGYSGLSRLMRLRPHFVKIDRSFISQLGIETAAAEVIRAIGHLSGRLDAWVIAEGVETADQLARLVEMDVPLAQGWALGRPSRGWPETTARESILGLSALTADTGAGTVGSLAGPLSQLGSPSSDNLSTSDGRPVLLVSPETPVTEAIERALALPEPWCWAPLVITDRSGAPIGAVRMETLIRAVLARPSGPPAINAEIAERRSSGGSSHQDPTRQEPAQPGGAPDSPPDEASRSQPADSDPDS